MPTAGPDDSVFLSVAQVPSVRPDHRPRDAATGLLTPDALRAAGQRLALDDGGPRGSSSSCDWMVCRAPRDNCPTIALEMLMHEIGAALRACSIGGDAAGRLTEDSFGIVSKASNDPSQMLHWSPISPTRFVELAFQTAR